ncbi:putative XS domain-containing protein [Helianthus annuus]|nr:putative XS domain-containing protein [Helianthus annuus]
MSQPVEDADNSDPNQNAKEEQFVWPWMAVVANIPSGKKLEDDWSEQGYTSVEVHALLNQDGHPSGLAVIEFGKKWDGFFHVMMFMKSFEVNKHGRKDWFDGEKCKGDELYAWIATDEDYNAYDLVGEFLRKNGDLKTIADVQREDESVIRRLKTMINEMDKRAEDMNSEISEVDIIIENFMKGIETMTENFNEGIIFKIVL